MNRRTHIDLQVQIPRRRPTAAMASSLMETTMNNPEKPASHSHALSPVQKTYGSRELFDGLREVGIEHGGAIYRLKITRQGKLILNK